MDLRRYLSTKEPIPGSAARPGIAPPRKGCDAFLPSWVRQNSYLYASYRRHQFLNQLNREGSLGTDGVGGDLAMFPRFVSSNRYGERDGQLFPCRRVRSMEESRELMRQLQLVLDSFHAGLSQMISLLEPDPDPESSFPDSARSPGLFPENDCLEGAHSESSFVVVSGGMSRGSPLLCGSGSTTSFPLFARISTEESGLSSEVPDIVDLGQHCPHSRLVAHSAFLSSWAEYLLVGVHELSGYHMARRIDNDNECRGLRFSLSPS